LSAFLLNVRVAQPSGEEARADRVQGDDPPVIADLTHDDRISSLAHLRQGPQVRPPYRVFDDRDRIGAAGSGQLHVSEVGYFDVARK